MLYQSGSLALRGLTALAALAAVCTAQSGTVKPSAVYDGGLGANSNGDVKLKIGNGGAGQSGLIKALADAFIQDSVGNGTEPFKVAWYTSDTTYSIKNMQSGILDVGITYSPAAERIAIEQGIAKSPSYYAFRDHFLLVGPRDNPANLTKSSDILTMFADLHEAAEGKETDPPTRFLSRFDKSATDIKEALLWASIGQVPWATAYSTWYHQYIDFPVQALRAAILLEEYTITDRGTLLTLQDEEPELTNKTVIYKAGRDDDPDDPLLNPAHLLIGRAAPNPDFAQRFADWVVSPAGGQKVCAEFKKTGEVLYSPAPKAGEAGAAGEKRWLGGMLQ